MNPLMNLRRWRRFLFFLYPHFLFAFFFFAEPGDLTEFLPVAASVKTIEIWRRTLASMICLLFINQPAISKISAVN